MNRKSNLQMLAIVAEGLQELADKVVFVGGAVAELYADNAALSEIRPTNDVDCMIEINRISDHAKLEDDLRKKGFANDMTPGAPICRWVYHGIIVDVMPTNDKILGFSNIWYSEGIKSREEVKISNEIAIFILPVEYYLATKIAAHNSRGGSDLRQSHDFEDIVYIVNNCSDLAKKITDTNVMKYLSDEFLKLLNNKGLNEGIESSLPYGSGATRVLKIVNVMTQISEL
ncbi:MAG: hypothetical protein PHE56_13140 [Bacteroidales bacterium]|nr:hypothetical protein [Bacteroidales bacterium]